jgi:CBS domain containing-hemolysin-like protein
MKHKTDPKWIIRIVLISVTMSMIFSLISSEILEGAGYIVAFCLLIVFIVIGIVFDAIGVAVTSATEVPFHSMASHKERGAVEALKLLRKAERVASICNDVVGDISGIISGATAATISANLVKDLNAHNVLTQLIVTGMVAGLTIGGKAIGKSIALSKDTQIVLTVGKAMSILTGFKKKK